MLRMVPLPMNGEELLVTDPTPAQLAADLCDLLDVEQIDTDLYRGKRQPGGVGRVFGGQVIAQALQSAQRSTDEKAAHSLHAYFMRPGNEDFPIIYRVVRDFDGRSFATRRVIATQQGQPILNMAASFQTPEEGLSHQDAMPEVAAPEDLKSEFELRQQFIDKVAPQHREWMTRPRPIEIRPVDRAQLVPARKARSRAAKLVPDLRPDRRRPGDAPRDPVLRLRHGVARHLDAAARHPLDDAQAAVRQP